MSTNKALKNLGKAWKNAKEEFGDSTGGFETVPTGTYVFHKITAELTTSKTSGDPMVSRCVTIKEGDYADQKVWDNNVLTTDRGPEFLLKWLNFMGYAVDSLEDDLEDVLEQITKNEDCVIKGQIKSDEFTNIYFNEILEEGDVPEAEEEEPEGEEPEGEEPEADGFDDMDRKELKAHIKEEELDIKVYKSMSDEDIVEAIRALAPEEAEEEEAEPEPEPEEEEEEEAPVKSGKKKTAISKQGSAKKDDAKTIKGLKGLCDAFGIDYNKGDDLATYVETMKEYTFKRKELDDKEVAALEAAGLEKLIKGK